MNRKAAGLAAGLGMLALTACSSSSPVANTTPTALASAPPRAAAVAAPVALDPCQVVTQAEASQLTGVTFGAGTEETTDGGGKICWYGAQTTDVFEVFVGQAADAATAQAQWDQEKSKVVSALQSKSTGAPTMTFNIVDTSISGADRAASGTMTYKVGTVTIGGTLLYLLKGATFTAIADLEANQTPPTIAAMEAEGQTVLGREP
ncbi:MAG TPA: hypothetical protein VF383_07615 [Candidatus Dormibacteraeota bacterium]